jgi:hypothetical protein
MFIRRLDVEKDYELYREAYGWDAGYPRWYKRMDSVFRPSFDEFITQARTDDQADIGVFDSELIGLISLTVRARGVFEAHLWAKRKSSVDVLACAAFQVRESLRGIGMREVYVWIERKNRAVQKLCAMAGMEFQGITLLKGHGGKLTEWRRFSVN